MDTDVRQGYLVTREWVGCPRYLEARDVHDWREQDRHAARWFEREREPLLDGRS